MCDDAFRGNSNAWDGGSRQPYCFSDLQIYNNENYILCAKRDAGHRWPFFQTFFFSMWQKQENHIFLQ